MLVFEYGAELIVRKMCHLQLPEMIPEVFVMDLWPNGTAQSNTIL